MAPSMRSPGSQPHTCDSASLPPTTESPTTESSPELPNCMPIVDPTFTWGCHESTTFITSLNAAYNEVVHWRPNLFRVPYGKAGKSFVSELARLYNSFASKSAMECIAMKAAVVLPILMLQKPSSKSKAKEHNSCLERRLNTWLDGDLDNLLFEGRTLQQRIPKSAPEDNSKRQKRHARSFANLMFEGKTKAAIRLLTEESKGGVLRLCDEVDSTRTVRDVLIEKHPPGQPAHADSIDCNDKPPEVHPVLFDSIDASLIRSAALRTTGAAGPSGLDAVCWRRLCTSFKAASQSLCQSLANTARRLCTDIVDPSITAPLFACRLIALNKNPGVRPIGIGDTARRIIAKAILTIAKTDIQDAAGSVQLCAGQISGIEAAVHAVDSLFQQENTEAILLVDASNAFNSLNRLTALHNIRHLCPSLATVLINSYRTPTQLFIDGDVLYSSEGTTQGDPLAMPMYALATIPLIKKLHSTIDDVRQVWYADDASAAGTVNSLYQWWTQLALLGPKFGYFANDVKTWLVTKEAHFSTASALFANTGVQVTTEGRPYLGSAIGSREFTISHVQEKVGQWTQELENLATIAMTQPHAAYAAFTHGLTSKWSYLTRTTRDVSSLLQPLELVIRSKFIPALTGQPPPDDELRNLLALPARLGGMALTNPTTQADNEFSASLKVTDPLKYAILKQSFEYAGDVVNNQMEAKHDVCKLKREKGKQAADSVNQQLSVTLKRAMDLAQERGASTWLTTQPIQEFGFTLHKSAFQDALALRYNWQLPRVPSTCACGSKFSVEHALSCPKGGFPSVRHNEIRDITASLLTEVCNDVCIEPELQPMTGEVLNGSSSNTQDGARLDIAANGFWGGRFERTYFDVRVFNPMQLQTGTQTATGNMN